jgi:hypothetical protein
MTEFRLMVLLLKPFIGLSYWKTAINLKGSQSDNFLICYLPWLIYHLENVIAECILFHSEFSFTIYSMWIFTYTSFSFPLWYWALNSGIHSC